MGELNLLEHPLCFAFPHRLAPSAWLGHVPFAMYTIDMLRPRILVELGAHYGVSYCAFCQGVKELDLETKCYAVDTWKGDPHGGFVGPEVLEDLKAYHEPLYGGFSRLIESTFDDAVNYFDDLTIDLLHIDGYHTYDVVRHDFETWLPKLSKRGVVLFHDINVRERDFGVWKYWQELKAQYPSFEFLHSHGLGLLAVGPQQPPLLRKLIATKGQELIRIRESFYQLGMRLEMINDLKRAQGSFQESAASCSADLQVKNNLIQEQQQQLVVKQQELVVKEQQFAVRDQQMLEQLSEKDLAVIELRQELQDKDSSLREQIEFSCTKEQQLAASELQLQEQTLELRAQEATAERRLQESQQKDQQLGEQAQQLNAERQTLLVRTKLLREKEALLEEQKNQLAAIEELVDAGHVQIQELSQKLEVKEQLLEEQVVIAREQSQQANMKEHMICEMSNEVKSLTEAIRGSTQQLEDAQSLLRQRDQLLEEKEARVQELLTSRALRIGSTLTWPVRKLRYSRFNLISPHRNGGENGACELLLPPPLAPPSPVHHQGLDSLTCSVVLGIVTYNNSPQQLAQLTRSIEIAAARLDRGKVSLRVFVIDNGEKCPWPESTVQVTRFPSQGNIGFGPAMNSLMSAAFADHNVESFLCVNPDGVMHRNCLVELLLSYKNHPRSLVEARQFPEEHTKTYDPQTLETTWASGACLLIPRDIHTVIGGFDPNFFMYLEDIDLSWRARSAGFEVRISPNALFGHGVLNRRHSPEAEKSFFLSGRYLAFKWKHAKFLRWAEHELVNRGHYTSLSDLPPLPKMIFNIAEFNPEVPDFEHHFHFSSARW